MTKTTKQGPGHPGLAERSGAQRRMWLNVYQVHQEYGGPEEGGWWYDVGSVVHSEATTLGADTDRILGRRISDEAIQRRMDDLRREHNDAGVRIVVWLEDERGADFPTERPYYN